MSARKRIAHGFTLVEILIVVVILGILAAIVIPQFTSASDSARQGNLETQLQTIRSQLELYRIQHNNVYPTVAQMFENLTNSSDSGGDTTGTVYGPYLQKEPGNPFTVGTNGTVVVAAGSAASTNGWTYDDTTGILKCSLSVAVDATLTMDTIDVETY